MTDNTTNPIDVSVYMLTYYHEKYIRQAIESVLAQRTGFRYEIVISDDYSMDGTRDILREYEARYPDIIRVNYNESNIGIPANIYKARCMCRGRYMVVLAGDDYWIRDDKIELEVGFLENHPEYVALCNRLELRLDDSTEAYGYFPKKSQGDRVFTIHDYERGNQIGMHGSVIRNYFLTEEGRAYFRQAHDISRYVDDAVDEVLILRKGDVYYMDICADAHRVFSSDTGKTNYNSRYSRVEKFRHHIDLLNNMYSRWGEEMDFSVWYARYCAPALVGYALSRQRSEYKEIFDTIPMKYRKPLIRSVYIKAWPYLIQLIVSKIKRAII